MDTKNITFNGVPLEELIEIQKRSDLQKDFNEESTKYKKIFYQHQTLSRKPKHSGKDFKPGKVKHLTPEQIAKEYNMVTMTNTEKVLNHFLESLSFDTVSKIVNATGVKTGTASSVITKIKQNMPGVLDTNGRGTPNDPFTYKLSEDHYFSSVDAFRIEFNRAASKAVKEKAKKPRRVVSEVKQTKMRPLYLAEKTRSALLAFNNQLLECVDHGLMVNLNFAKDPETQTPQVELKILKEI